MVEQASLHPRPATDNRFAAALRGLDQHRGAAPGHRIGREEHPAGRRLDHLLHDDGHFHPGSPVRRDARTAGRGAADVNRREQGGRALDVEDGVEHPGVTRVGRVLDGRARTDRHRSRPEPLVRPKDLGPFAAFGGDAEAGWHLRNRLAGENRPPHS